MCLESGIVMYSRNTLCSPKLTSYVGNRLSVFFRNFVFFLLQRFFLKKGGELPPKCTRENKASNNKRLG